MTHASKFRHLILLALATLALGFGLSRVAHGQSKPTDPWPRQIQIAGATITAYQPQVDSWDGGFLKLRAAVSVKPAGAGEEVFGIVRASAHTLVDRSTRMVTLFNFSLLQIDFPSLPDHGQKYQADLARFLPAGTKQISLDRLQGVLAVEKLTARTVEAKNDPPRIIVSYKPAVLVPIQGAPARRNIAGSSPDRVVNTRALIAYGPSGNVFLHGAVRRRHRISFSPISYSRQADGSHRSAAGPGCGGVDSPIRWNRRQARMTLPGGQEWSGALAWIIPSGCGRTLTPRPY